MSMLQNVSLCFKVHQVLFHGKLWLPRSPSITAEGNGELGKCEWRLQSWKPLS